MLFPTDVFPGWLRVIADNLPLSHFNGAMRQIAAEGSGFVDVLPSLLAIIAWGALSYAAAARTFKWV